MTALYIIAALVFGYLSGWHAAWNQMQQQRIKQLEGELAIDRAIGRKGMD